MKGTERRSFPALELRAENEGAIKIRGHAAVFNSFSENLGGFRERIMPGAFDRALAKSDVRALWNHEPLYVLGRQSAKTLSLTVDERGLHIENDPPDTQWARDLLVSIQRGDVREMSFGFTVAQGGDKWETGADGIQIRTITEFEQIYDISAVTFPAYPQTDVALRGLEAFLSGERSFPDTEVRRRRNELEAVA